MGATVTAADGSSYFGVNPQIDIDESSNVDGLEILPGTSITWIYEVTNPGNVPLSNVTVTDSVSGVTPVLMQGDIDADDQLDTDEIWVYEASGTTIKGAYTSTGTARGSYSDSASHSRTATATDTSSYFGADPGFSVSMGCKADSEPIPQEGPALFTVTFTTPAMCPHDYCR